MGWGRDYELGSVYCICSESGLVWSDLSLGVWLGLGIYCYGLMIV